MSTISASKGFTMSEPLPLWIGGRPEQGVGLIERENPASPSQSVGSVESADAASTARAVTSAHEAFPSWAALPVEERVALVTAAIEAADVERLELAELLASEVGKVVTDARGELSFAAAFAAFAGPHAIALCADETVEDAEGRLVIAHEPFGVVAAITAWNAPVILAALKVVPALMTGNTMVLKPSPLAPLTVTRYLSAVAAELPAGVLNVVNGGGDVGAALVGHPLVSKISFTGGLQTARIIAASAAEQITPTVMELGGNDAAIFLPDAEYTDAMYERAVFGAFLTSGQVCMAAKRLFVPRGRLDEFVEGFSSAAARVLKVGDPGDSASTMGPVVTRRDQERLSELLASAVAAGGTATTIGEIRYDDSEGYWVPPTIVTGLADEHPLVSQEQFGPVLPILVYDTEEEAIERANSVDQALASSVWSTDEEHARSVARRLNAGFTFINCANRAGTSLRAPFGGRGRSGHGREFSALGIGEYLQTHSINYPNAVRSGEARGNAYPAGA